METRAEPTNPPTVKDSVGARCHEPGPENLVHLGVAETCKLRRFHLHPEHKAFFNGRWWGWR